MERLSGTSNRGKFTEGKGGVNGSLTFKQPYFFLEIGLDGFWTTREEVGGFYAHFKLADNGFVQSAADLKSATALPG